MCYFLNDEEALALASLIADEIMDEEFMLFISADVSPVFFGQFVIASEVAYHEQLAELAERENEEYRQSCGAYDLENMGSDYSFLDDLEEDEPYLCVTSKPKPWAEVGELIKWAAGMQRLYDDIFNGVTEERVLVAEPSPAYPDGLTQDEYDTVVDELYNPAMLNEHGRLVNQVIRVAGVPVSFNDMTSDERMKAVNADLDAYHDRSWERMKPKSFFA